MAYSVAQEVRPLKRPRLGAPDFYPQELKQKEDELTADKLKQGFINPIHQNEYQSAREKQAENQLFAVKPDAHFLTKIITTFNGIQAKKAEVNALQDFAKKKVGAAAGKELVNFALMAQKSKADPWFKDLAGNRSLAALAKRVPYINRKDEILAILCEFQIPMCRAVWFIKVTAQYAVQHQETGKLKRKQNNDPCYEWTSKLLVFMKDSLLAKLTDYYSTNSQQQTTVTVDVAEAQKQWQYCCKLSRAMDEEGLLDRQLFGTNLLEIFSEKCRSPDEGILRLLLPLLLQHMNGILQSVVLSRKFAHWCAKKLAAFYLENTDCASPCSPSSNRPSSPCVWYTEYLNCPLHRYLILSLSAMVHAIVAECPEAVVWNNLSGGTAEHSSGLCGSPLDLLPCAPSALPMPPGEESEKIRKELMRREDEIRMRSAAVDSQWSCDKCQQSGIGTLVQQFLLILDVLDKQKFDRCDESSSASALGNVIFAASSRDGEESAQECEKNIVKLLCQWAITSHRFGHHRAAVVAKLLHNRQKQICETTLNKIDGASEQIAKDSFFPSDNGELAGSVSHCFQSALFEFLDNEAANIGHSGRAEFSAVIGLFGELIRQDVFSYERYLSTLIARGDVSCFGPNLSTAMAGSIQVATAANSSRQQLDGDGKKPHSVEFADTSSSSVPADQSSSSMDLCYLATTTSVKEDFRSASTPFSKTAKFVSLNEPRSITSESTKKDRSSLNMLGSSMVGSSALKSAFPSVLNQSATHGIASRTSAVSSNSSGIHCLSLLQFPLPQTDDYRNEASQRLMLLYGFGTARDAHYHSLRKLSKELNKLWNKKFCVTVLENGFVKPRRKSLTTEFLTSLSSKFKGLPCHDQCQIVVAVGESCGNVLQDFLAKKSNLLPALESVDYVLSLMECTNCLWTVLDFAIEILEDLPKIDLILRSRNSLAVDAYVLNTALCFVAYLRRYHMYLILNEEETCAIFKSILELVGRFDLSNGVNSAAEKCLWLYLHHLFNTCAFIKKEFAQFESSASVIKQWIGAKAEPSKLDFPWDKTILKPYLDNPKSPIDDETVKLLQDSAQARYGFVANVVVAILQAKNDKERVRDVGLLCCDLTVRCPSLSGDWLGVLYALCCPAVGVAQHSGYVELIQQIDISDTSLHQPLALLCVLLVGRHCIHLEDFARDVAMYSLAGAISKTVKSVTSSQPDANSVEPQARLTLHLLAALLCLSHQQGKQLPWSHLSKFTSDYYLLCSAHGIIVSEGVMSLLVVQLILADNLPVGVAAVGSNSQASSLASMPKISSEPSISEILGTTNNDSSCDSAYDSSINKSAVTPQEGSLAVTSSDVLRLVCAQEWVRYKMHEAELFTNKFLLHRSISPAQAGRLLRSLTRGECEAELVAKLETVVKHKDVVTKLLSTLSIWNLRASLLELKLLHRQAEQNGVQEVSKVLDAVAKGFMDLFQSQSEQAKRPQTSVIRSGEINSVWLASALVSQLSKDTQGRVLKVAADVLEKDRSAWHKNSWLLSEQPFLSLVLTCLRGQDEQREPLLNNLQKQLQQYVTEAKNSPLQFFPQAKTEEVREALQLRLSLVKEVGGMFETICRGTSLDQWALLLLQLLQHGVVSYSVDKQLYFACIDMLTVLVQSVVVYESEKTSSEESKKNNYTKIMKALKKEIGEHCVPWLRPVFRLLPIPRRTVDVIITEPYGTVVSTSKSASKSSSAIVATSTSSRQGLQPAEKRKLSPWDVIECKGTGSSLSASLFHAVRSDAEEAPIITRLTQLLPHEHYYQLKRPSHPGDGKSDCYLDPLNLPYDMAFAEADASDVSDGGRGLDMNDPSMSPQSLALSVGRGGRGGRKSVGGGGGGKGQRKNSKQGVGPVRSIPYTMPNAPGGPMPYGAGLPDSGPGFAGGMSAMHLPPGPSGQQVCGMDMNPPHSSMMQPDRFMQQQQPTHSQMNLGPQQRPSYVTPGLAKSVLSQTIRSRQPSGVMPSNQPNTFMPNPPFSGHPTMHMGAGETGLTPHMQMQMERSRQGLVQEGMNMPTSSQHVHYRIQRPLQFMSSAGVSAEHQQHLQMEQQEKAAIANRFMQQQAASNNPALQQRYLQMQQQQQQQQAGGARQMEMGNPTGVMAYRQQQQQPMMNVGGLPANFQGRMMAPSDASFAEQHQQPMRLPSQAVPHGGVPNVRHPQQAAIYRQQQQQMQQQQYNMSGFPQQQAQQAPQNLQQMQRLATMQQQQQQFSSNMQQSQQPANTPNQQGYFMNQQQYQ